GPVRPALTDLYPKVVPHRLWSGSAARRRADRGGAPVFVHWDSSGGAMEPVLGARPRALSTPRPPRRRRARHLMRRRRGMRALAASLVAVLTGSVLAAFPASAAWAAFPTNEAIVYLAQGNGASPQRTQLMRGLQSNGQITFSNIGAPHSVAEYNAIGFNEQDGYIYGVRASSGNGPKIVRVGPAGGVTVVKDAAAGSVSGAFGAVANRFYYFTQTTMYFTNVAAPAGGTTSVGLTGQTAGGVPADVTFANGYFWGYGGGGVVTRIALDGTVARFTVPALSGHSAAGGAFTYGNGNLGFSKNSGGILQVRVTNPGTATPSFTLVSQIAGPGSSANDATSSLGDPSDLAI